MTDRKMSQERSLGAGPHPDAIQGRMPPKKWQRKLGKLTVPNKGIHLFLLQQLIHISRLLDTASFW
jgi:hypothetical protein